MAKKDCQLKGPEMPWQYASSTATALEADELVLWYISQTGKVHANNLLRLRYASSICHDAEGV